MALKDEIPALVEIIDQTKPRLANSKDLLCIYENDLLRFIEQMFLQEMGTQTFAAIKPRIPPINVLRKIVDKLSKIFQEGVMRKVSEEGSDQDQDLLDWYIDQFDANMKFNQGNEFLNLDRINLMQPYYDEVNRKPALRAVPNDRYVIYSNNKMNPQDPTHVMMNKGKAISLSKDNRRTKNPMMVETWIVWTNEEILIIDEEGQLRPDLMMMSDMDGTNPFGVLPFEYFNSSQNFLIPPSDSDTKRMTVLIPALLADLNYAAKFQSFSQIFVFNAEKETWTLAPNAVHFLDDKPGTDSAARVDVIKPQVDITEVVQLVVTEMSMWLNSRGIKPGTMGNLSAENLASGVSKIIDEMDTAELRQVQAQIYTRGEQSMWNKVLNHMHPLWVSEGKVENRHIFTPSAKVEVTFPPQKPIVDRGSLVTSAVAELNAGLKSQQTLIEELNPDWDQERIDSELEMVNGLPDIEPTTDPSTVGDVVGEARQSAPVADVAPEEVLNGAQVTSLLNVTAEVGLGNLPKSSAKAVLQAAFGLSPERSNQIIDPIEITGPVDGPTEG